MNRHLPLLVLLAGLWIVSPVSAGTIADVSALPLGTDATIDQAVILSTTDLTADPLYKSFQLRDSTRAITVYGTNADIDAALTGFGVGDVITISGQTGDVGGALALIRSIGGFAVSGRTATLPLLTNAVFVSPSDINQPYESNLVCLQDVSFADTSLQGEHFRRWRLRSHQRCHRPHLLGRSGPDRPGHPHRSTRHHGHRRPRHIAWERILSRPAWASRYGLRSRTVHPRPPRRRCRRSAGLLATANTSSIINDANKRTTRTRRLSRMPINCGRKARPSDESREAPI